MNGCVQIPSTFYSHKPKSGNQKEGPGGIMCFYGDRRHLDTLYEYTI